MRGFLPWDKETVLLVTVLGLLRECGMTCEGRVVWRALRRVLSIPFTGADPSFAFAVVTLGRLASSAGAPRAY